MVSADGNKVFIVDFGLGHKYLTADGEHMKEATENVSFKGTISYASLNAHLFKVRIRLVTNFLGFIKER